MKAIVKTKSNYKNCNGKELEVHELLGKIICCYVPSEGFDENGNPKSDKYTFADFNVESELISLRK